MYICNIHKMNLTGSSQRKLIRLVAIARLIFYGFVLLVTMVSFLVVALNLYLIRKVTLQKVSDVKIENLEITTTADRRAPNFSDSVSIVTYDTGEDIVNSQDDITYSIISNTCLNNSEGPKNHTFSICYENITFYHETFVYQKGLASSFWILILSLVLVTLLIVQEVQLLKGANEKNLWRVNSWFQMHTVFTMLFVLALPILVSLTPIPFDFPSICAAFVTAIIMKSYFLWKVHVFLSELKEDLENSKTS